jgi:predicted site-specific integrase-resolvase
MLRKIKPQNYINEFYPGSEICTKTIVNWIKSGKLNGEQTLTGRWLVVIDPPESSEVELLVQMLESS